MADAFLIFKSKETQRQVHELNERAIGEWQLRLMPCSSWALHDALAQGEYQRLELLPKLTEAVADQVRNGYRASTTAAEVKQPLAGDQCYI